MPTNDTYYCNLEICEKCTRHLTSWLSESPTIFQLYNDIIIDQKGSDFIVKVPLNSQSANVHYLSHHLIAKALMATDLNSFLTAAVVKVRKMQALTTTY